MRRSISFKIFSVMVGLWLLVSMLQLFLLNQYFEQIYLSQMLKNYHRELEESVAFYTGGDDYTSSAALRRYTQETGSPVLVMTDSFSIGDRELFRKLGLVEIDLNGSETVMVPLAFTYELTTQPYLAPTFSVNLNAIQLGNSRYYEPLSLEVQNKAYNNRESIRKYRIDSKDESIQPITEYGHITAVSNVFAEGNSLHHYAKLIYDAAKDCLILHLPPDDYWTELAKSNIADSLGNEYRLIVEKRLIGQDEFFFIALRQIMITGQERGYLTPVFYGVFIFTGLIFVLATFLLSKYTSRSLAHISDVTRQISQLDFSRKVQRKGQDELAQLAQSINAMSDNLENALDELRIASVRAQENEERMKKLLADMAHEFKTPLSIITFYMDALENQLSEDNRFEYYKVIDEEVEHLTEMVDESIELSQLQSGNWKIDIGIWRLRDIVNMAVSKFNKQLMAEGFDFTQNIADVTVYADSKRIIQVLNNFLSNAIKYCDEARSIALEAKVTGPDTVTVFVANSGFLSPEDQELVWQRHYRVTGNYTARLPGQGIGLDIVKTILEAHASDYGIKQENGMTSFYFTLKVSDYHDDVVE